MAHVWFGATQTSVRSVRSPHVRIGAQTMASLRSFDYCGPSVSGGVLQLVSVVDTAVPLLAERRCDVTEPELRRIRMLGLLYDHDRDHPGEAAGVVDLLGSQYDPPEEHLWLGVVRELDAQGLIKLGESMGFDGTSATITDRGREEVATRRTRRADPVHRNNAARDAVVRFLYAQPDHTTQDMRSLLSSPLAIFEGDVLTVDDVDGALVYLERKHMVDGSHVEEKDAVLHPRLTDRGIDCAEQFDGSVSEYVRASEGGTGNNTVNFYGDVTGSNVGWNSRQITQTATTSTGLAGDELASLVGAIMQALPVLGLSESDSTRLRGQLEVAQAELEDAEPDAGVVKSVLKRVLSTIGAVAGDSLGILLTAYAKDLMRKAGVPLD